MDFTTWLLLGFLAIVLGVGMVVFFVLCVRKIRPGRAGVKTGFGGVKVSFDWMIRIPLLQTYHIVDISVKKLEITRKAHDGLVCKDNIRADITVAFYIRVEATEESVKQVSQMLTPERVSDLDQLRDLFEAKFSEALKTAGKQMNFHELFTERLRFRDEIQTTIGKDLDGFILQDVAIDYLEQTPLADHDPDNVLDAEGIKLITEITRRENVLANEFSQRAAVEIEKENADADIAKRAQQRRNEEDNAKQHRAIVEVKTNEEAEERKIQELRRMEVETKRLETEEAIKLREEDMNRAVQEREFTVTKEKQRLTQEAEQEGEEARVRRERVVSLAEMDKEVRVAEAAVEVERRRAIVVAEQKAVVEKEEEKKTVGARMTAERDREVTLIAAEKDAKKDQVARVVASEAEREAEANLAEAAKIKVVKAAEADREAADRESERMLVIAEAEARASEKQRHAMEERAEGTAAETAAPGLAEARVIAAKAEAMKQEADANRSLGFAEAEVTEKQALAEALAISEREQAVAKGIEEKAAAMKLFHEAGKEHEEFRLRLEKDRDVELAAIEAKTAIAAAHSDLVGEALKHAKIDIVGGENDFFQKIVRSVGSGKAIDRFIDNSPTLKGVRSQLLENGGLENLRERLRKHISDSGIGTEDLKNLTVSALVAKLLLDTKDSSLRQSLEAVKDWVGKSGIGDQPADDLL